MASDGRVSEAKELEVIELIGELAPIYAMVENKMDPKMGGDYSIPQNNNVAVLQESAQLIFYRTLVVYHKVINYDSWMRKSTVS